jgi:hypothetical protein
MGVTRDGDDGLLRDRRGAIMVMGVFLAAFLVGVMYYLMGIGETILHRERMQDVADGAAFGAAVIHARGMNILVLINLMMAAFAAVATAYDIVTSSLQFALAYATVICAASEGTSDACDYIETYAEESQDAADEADEVEDDVEDLLDALHAAAIAVRRGIPIMAQAKVVQYGGHAPAEGGMMWPVADELPVEDDDDDWPCHEKVAPPAQWLSALGIIDYTISAYLFVGWATGLAMAEEHSEEWCDDDYFQRVLEDAELGDEHFQVVSIMWAEPPFDVSRRAVGVAAWSQEPESDATVDALEELSQLALAQAEFYFDGNVEREEWMWSMRWRARLRRLSVLEDARSLTEACTRAGGRACDSMSLLGSISDTAVH